MQYSSFITIGMGEGDFFLPCHRWIPYWTTDWMTTLGQKREGKRKTMEGNTSGRGQNTEQHYMME